MIISDNYLAIKPALYKVRKSFLSLPREKIQCFWNNNNNDNKILNVKQTSKQKQTTNRNAFLFFIYPMKTCFLALCKMEKHLFQHIPSSKEQLT